MAKEESVTARDFENQSSRKNGNKLDVPALVLGSTRLFMGYENETCLKVNPKKSRFRWIL